MKTGLFKSVEEAIHDALAAQDSEAEWLIDNKATINEKIARGIAQLDRLPEDVLQVLEYWTNPDCLHLRDGLIG